VGVRETEGLARRVRDAEDGRIVRVEATTDGKAFVLRGRSQRVARIGRALAALDKMDMTRLEAAIGALERLVADLERAPAGVSTPRLGVPHRGREDSGSRWTSSPNPARS